MNNRKSLSFFRQSGMARLGLGGALAQLIFAPLATVSTAHAGAQSHFELGTESSSAQSSELTRAQIQALLQQLDAAVAEAVSSSPEVMEALENALEQEWPAIEAGLPATGAEAGAPSPEASPAVPAPDAPLPEPSPSEAPEVGAPSPEASLVPAPTPSVESPSQPPLPAPQPTFSAGPVDRPAPRPSAQPSAPRSQESWDRVFGWDFLLGVPSGLGLSVNVTPIRPITVSVGVTTPLGVTVTAQAEVTLNILPIFMNARWTPTVTVGYRYVHFTGLTDVAIELATAGALADSDIAFQVKGTGLHMVTAMAGLEYVGKKGFHFGLRAGRVMQVGQSVGQTDESGLVFSNFQSWSVLLLFGRRY